MTPADMSDASQYEHIGAYLRDLREHFGLSVDDVAHRLHIRSKYIMALEEGRMDEMPGKVYTVGYIQNYAEFLGLDAKNVVDEYHALGQLDKNLTFKIVEPNHRQGAPALSILIGCAAVLLVSFLLWQFFSGTDTTPDNDMVAAVSQDMLSQANNALTLTSRNAACLSMKAHPVFPPCYPLDYYERPTAFIMQPLGNMLELR